MPLYTRCPACRSEISFEPPKNMAELPEDYKYRIKCPSCGVTIGVRLNVIARQPVQESPTAFRPIADQGVPSYPGAQAPSEPARSDPKPKKKPGTGRNVLLMILSLLIVALGVVGYLFGEETISFGGNNSNFGLKAFNGIGGFEMLITDFAGFKAEFSKGIMAGIATIIPMALFVFAGITFIVALISACGKKYSRAFNVVWSILTFLLGVALIFVPYLTDYSGLAIASYFKTIVVQDKLFALFAPAVLGFLQMLFSLIFIKSLEPKRK